MSAIIDIHSFEEIGKMIKARRIQRNISQEQLASMYGLSRYTLVDIENGKSDPKLSTVLKLTQALGFRVALVPSEVAASPLDSLPEVDSDLVEVDFKRAWKGD